MTDAKKNENSKAAVAELLGERKRPWYVRAVPAVVVLALAAGGGWYWAPLPADFPIRPGFWNVPLWGEIGVYVAAVITIALCAWGVCKNIEVWRRRKDEKLPSDPSRRDRLLKEAVLEEKVRQTSAGRMHAVLVVGFFLLFLGTATATLDWDVGHYVFGKQFLRGNVYLAYKL